MAVVTDQQGQAVRLARVIGVDQQPGSGAVLARVEKSGHGAPCRRRSRSVWRKCRNMKANSLNLPPFFFIYQEVVGVEENRPSGDPFQGLRQQPLQLGAQPHHLPMMISTGLWPSRARAACSRPSSVALVHLLAGLQPATTRATGTRPGPPPSASLPDAGRPLQPHVEHRGVARPGQPCQP